MRQNDFKMRIINQFKDEYSAARTLMFAGREYPRLAGTPYVNSRLFVCGKMQLTLLVTSVLDSQGETQFQVQFKDAEADSGLRWLMLNGVDFSRETMFKKEYFEERIAVTGDLLLFDVTKYIVENKNFNFSHKVIPADDSHIQILYDLSLRRFYCRKTGLVTPKEEDGVYQFIDEVNEKRNSNDSVFSDFNPSQDQLNKLASRIQAAGRPEAAVTIDNVIRQQMLKRNNNNSDSFLVAVVRELKLLKDLPY